MIRFGLVACFLACIIAAAGACETECTAIKIEGLELLDKVTDRSNITIVDYDYQKGKCQCPDEDQATHVTIRLDTDLLEQLIAETRKEAERIMESMDKNGIRQTAAGTSEIESKMEKLLEIIADKRKGKIAAGQCRLKYGDLFIDPTFHLNNEWLEQLIAETRKRAEGMDKGVATQIMRDRLTPLNQLGIRRYAPKMKEPVVGAICSIVVPGAGQAYNGQYKKAGALLGANVLGWALFIASLDRNAAGELDFPDGNGGNAGMGFLAVAIGSHLYSVIDAPIISNRINERHQHTHMFQHDGQRFMFGIDPITSGNRLGTSFSLWY